MPWLRPLHLDEMGIPNLGIQHKLRRMGHRGLEPLTSSMSRKRSRVRDPPVPLACPVAQLEERRTTNPENAGSSPAALTCRLNRRSTITHGVFAGGRGVAVSIGGCEPLGTGSSPVGLPSRRASSKLEIRISEFCTRTRRVVSSRWQSGWLPTSRPPVRFRRGALESSIAVRKHVTMIGRPGGCLKRYQSLSFAILEALT